MPNWEAPGNSKGTLPVYIEQAYTDNLGYDVAFMSGSEIVDSSPRFIGSTHPYSVVYAWDNGVVVGSTRAAADGSWSLSAQFTDGQHSLTFGLDSTAVTLPMDFIVNSAAAIPVLVEQGFTDNLGYDSAIFSGDVIVDSTPRFDGTAAPEAIIYAWDAGKLVASTVSDSDGKWSLETPLKDGQHALTFGSSAEESTLPYIFSIDSTKAIPVTIVQGYEDHLGYDDAFMSGDEIIDSTPRFIGTAAPEAIIYAWDAGTLVASTVSDSDGKWSLETPLKDGQHALTFGSSAEESTLPYIFSIDSTKAIPVTIVQGYEDHLGYDDAFMSGDEIIDSTPRFIGTAAPEAIIYAWDYGVLLGSTVSELDGSWSITLPELALGGHAVTFGSEPEVTSNPMYFSVQSAEAMPANINIADLLSHSETLLLSDSDNAPQTYSQPFSLTQQDLSVQSQNGITGTSSAFTPELEEHFA